MRNILTCAGCKTDFWYGVKYTWLSSSTCSLLSSMLISSSSFQDMQRQIGRLSADSVRNVAISDNIFFSLSRITTFRDGSSNNYSINLHATQLRRILCFLSGSSRDEIWYFCKVPDQPLPKHALDELPRLRLIVDRKKTNIDQCR